MEHIQIKLHGTLASPVSSFKSFVLRCHHIEQMKNSLKSTHVQEMQAILKLRGMAFISTTRHTAFPRRKPFQVNTV